MTPKPTNLDRIISALEGLTRAEVLQLRDIIDTFLSEGYLNTVSPGYLEYKFVTRGVKRFGPTAIAGHG